MVFQSLNLSLVLSCLLPAPVGDTRGLISKALTEPTQITLENIKLADAIAEITRQTGVKIVMSPEAMRLVPEGSQTIIQRVHIANVPLREGLERLFGPLGMTFELGDDHLRIVPKEALLCLGRTPTWTELETLSQLSAAQPGLRPDDLDNLQKRIQFQVPAPDPWGALAQVMRNVGAGPGDELLTLATHQLGWTWCLSGDRIVVGTFDQLLRRRLRQPISLRMNNRPLIEIIQAVGTAVNIPVRTEPGVLATLPAQIQKNFSISAVNLPAEQVLEGIAANTGLGYLLSSDGIVFYSPEGGAAAMAAGMAGQPPAPPSGAADPYVAKISIELGDGKTFEWLIRRSELPEDLKQMRDRDIQQFIDEFRQRRVTAGHP